MPGMTMDAMPPRLTFGRLFTEWSLHPWSASILAALAIGYLVGVWAARRHGEPVRARYVVSWLAGVGVLVVATQGSPAVYDDALFWMHMVAHLMLIMVAPVLLVAARPLDLIIAATPPAQQGHARAVMSGRVVSALTHPSVGLALYAALIVGTHLTGFMNTMMMHPWLHGAEVAMYVVAGVLFMLPLLGSQPIRWQLAAPLQMAILVIAMPVDTFTGVVLGQAARYPWPMMAAVHPAWAPSTLTDLHLGGAVMWIGGDAIMAVLLVLAGLRWARRASEGDGSELGGWLEAARLNYQRDLVSARTNPADAGFTEADGDDALAAYNAYLARLNADRG